MTDYRDYSFLNISNTRILFPSQSDFVASSYVSWDTCGPSSFQINMPMGTKIFNIFSSNFSNSPFSGRTNLWNNQNNFGMFNFDNYTFPAFTSNFNNFAVFNNFTFPAMSFMTSTTGKSKSSKSASGSSSSGRTTSSSSGKSIKTRLVEISSGYCVKAGSWVNTDGLKSYMREKIVMLDKKAKELGYTLVLIDGFRSHATQAAAKRRKPKLCASPYKSAHEYGVAVDIALYKNGKKVSDIKREVPEFGNYAQSIGLEWGAGWNSKYEPWHFNMKKWTELADVKGEYRRLNHLA